MKRLSTTYLLLMLAFSGVISYAQSVDQFDLYPLVQMNQHATIVKDSFQRHKNIRVIKGNMYPRKEYADSNLYATIYIHAKEKDPVSQWGTTGHLGISFYRNRVFHMNYLLMVENESMLQGIYNWLTGELGTPSDSLENITHSSPNDYHELTKPDQKIVWHGDVYDVEFLIEKKILQYQVEIVKVSKSAHQKYLDEVNVVEEQKTKMGFEKARKVRNLNRITLETIYSMIDIVSDYKHYSYLEAILPNYTRTGVVFHKRKHDANGIYWGYRNMECKAYYVYEYDIMDKNPVYKKRINYFKKLTVYCDTDHHIFQVRIDFQHDPLLADIEPGILKAECIQHYNRNNLLGYYDLLQSAIITVKINDDHEPKGQHMIISKEFLEYLVDMDE